MVLIFSLHNWFDSADHDLKSAWQGHPGTTVEKATKVLEALLDRSTPYIFFFFYSRPTYIAQASLEYNKKFFQPNPLILLVAVPRGHTPNTASSLSTPRPEQKRGVPSRMPAKCCQGKIMIRQALCSLIKPLAVRLARRLSRIMFHRSKTLALVLLKISRSLFWLRHANPAKSSCCKSYV